MFESLLYLVGFAFVGQGEAIRALISSSIGQEAVPIAKDFTSFSIEYSILPDYAGNDSHPNEFSINLLYNLGNLTGLMPVIRVGGGTQDDAIYNSDIHGHHNDLHPSFFSSFTTFPNTKFIPGINLALNGTAGDDTRRVQAELTCKALGDNLYMFEVGNEPNHFVSSSKRPTDWTIKDYVEEWLKASKLVLDVMSSSCPQIAKKSPGFFAPSFGSTEHSKPFSVLAAFQSGLDSRNDITEISVHNYMHSASNPKVTLQDSLMNHDSIKHKLESHITLAAQLRNFTTAPYVLGETNSLSGGGSKGLSDVFGAALWVVDYSLYAASNGILRAHFHQAGSYNAWTVTDTPTTNAPYYGNIMVNAAIGANHGTVIAPLELSGNDPRFSAYTLCDSRGEGEVPCRVVILNMREWTSTTAGTRPVATITLTMPAGVTGARVERLTAAGADVTTGITYAGISYDYDLAKGKPVQVDKAAATETITVNSGTSTLTVDIQDSEGVVLHLQTKH